MKHKEIEYVLTWFEKEGDEFIVGKCLLENISLEELVKLFKQPPEEKMVYCYNVLPNNVNYLQKFVKHQIDLDKYDYFMEGQAAEIKIN